MQRCRINISIATVSQFPTEVSNWRWTDIKICIVSAGILEMGSCFLRWAFPVKINFSMITAVIESIWEITSKLLIKLSVYLRKTQCSAIYFNLNKSHLAFKLYFVNCKLWHNTHLLSSFGKYILSVLIKTPWHCQWKLLSYLHIPLRTILSSLILCILIERFLLLFSLYDQFHDVFIKER